MASSSSSRAIKRTNRFGRDVRKLSREVQEEAFRISLKLAEDVFDANLNIKQMVGLRGIWRVVVIRDYRMVFSFDQDSVFLLRIGHRREIYRSLEL